MPYDGAMKLLIAALAVLVFGFAPAASARQDDPRLDALFARLTATANFGEARPIEREIWAIWIEAGDEKLDHMMDFGVGAMHQGQFGPALESFNAIIAADPGFAEGWNKRATLYYYMGRFDESISDVERTLALEPRHFGALSGMGLISTALEDEASALEWFERALEVNPHMPGIEHQADLLRERLKGDPI